MEETNIAGLVHCPESNLKLGSGICPVSSLGKVNVCVGTDGASSNDDLDMIGELRTASLVDNYRSVTVLGHLNRSLSMVDWLRAGTINGAKALKIDHLVGSLEKGKEADFISIKINALPVYSVRNTVLMSGNNEVTNVWVAGKPLLREGVITVLDEDRVNQTAIQWGENIKAALHELHPTKE